MKLRIWLTLTTIAALALTEPAVHAEPSGAADAAKAERLIDQGLALREARRDRDALPHFVEAHRLAPTPRASAQLGFVLQALGQWLPAERHLRAALAATSDGWVRERRALLEESLAFVEARLGSITVDSNVREGEVTIDAEPVGRLPLARPLRLAAGPHVLGLKAAGFLPGSLDVHVAPRQTARVSLNLAPAAAAPIAIASPAPPLAIDARAAEPAPPPIHHRWWFWTGLAVVAAGAVAVGLAATSAPSPHPCGADGRVCAR